MVKWRASTDHSAVANCHFLFGLALRGSRIKVPCLRHGFCTDTPHLTKGGPYYNGDIEQIKMCFLTILETMTMQTKNEGLLVGCDMGFWVLRKLRPSCETQSRASACGISRFRLHGRGGPKSALKTERRAEQSRAQSSKTRRLCTSLRCRLIISSAIGCLSNLAQPASLVAYTVLRDRGECHVTESHTTPSKCDHSGKRSSALRI